MVCRFKNLSECKIVRRCDNFCLSGTAFVYHPVLIQNLRTHNTQNRLTLPAVVITINIAFRVMTVHHIFEIFNYYVSEFICFEQRVRRFEKSRTQTLKSAISFNAALSKDNQLNARAIHIVPTSFFTKLCFSFGIIDVFAHSAQFTTHMALAEYIL